MTVRVQARGEHWNCLPAINISDNEDLHSPAYMLQEKTMLRLCMGIELGLHSDETIARRGRRGTREMGACF